MSKEQIEGMAHSVCRLENKPKGCAACMWKATCSEYLSAEAYYNAGYRKQSENTIELQCKIGEAVYSIVIGITQVFVGEVYEMFIGRNGMVFRATRKGYFTLAFTNEDIGKTVFFSKEEAEKALAKMKGGAE